MTREVQYSATRLGLAMRNLIVIVVFPALVIWLAGGDAAPAGEGSERSPIARPGEVERLIDQLAKREGDFLEMQPAINIETVINATSLEIVNDGTDGGAAIVRTCGPDDVLAQVRDLAHARREHFVVLLLNARHELQCRETISIGSLNASIVHPREVFLPAILHSAASIVLVHNHPSGDPEPSEEDLSITRRLIAVGELVGIGVLDHVIVASRGTVSFRSRELL